jgi:hypothetical protein
MQIGKRISWLAFTEESKAYLRDYDVEGVFGKGRTTIIIHEVTLRRPCH